MKKLFLLLLPFTCRRQSMKGMLKFFSFLLLPFLLNSCGEGNPMLIMPKSTFDAPFPKRNRDLSRVLGSNLKIWNGYDTLDLKLSSTKTHNLIVNKSTGDTLLYGPVSKYRGLYFCSYQYTDTSYWITAIKIQGNLVYGLSSPLDQMYLVDSLVEKGQCTAMLKYMDSEHYRLHPDKKEMRKIYAQIMKGVIPDTIVDKETGAHPKLDEIVSPELFDPEQTIAAIDPEDFVHFSKAYPNPAKDNVTIELQQKGKVSYTLSSMSGQVVRSGEFTDVRNALNLEGIPGGVYYLAIYSAEENLQERIPIIVATK